MALSPVPLSPRPNPPGSVIPANAAKTKTLAILNHKSARSPSLASAATTPGIAEREKDIGAQMNDEVRNRFVIGEIMPLFE